MFYIQNATSADSGVYKILAKNDAGDSQALINLTVDAEPAPPYDDLLHYILYFSFFFRKDEDELKKPKPKSTASEESKKDEVPPSKKPQGKQALEQQKAQGAGNHKIYNKSITDKHSSA